jgi:hypothetical protein
MDYLVPKFYKELNSVVNRKGWKITGNSALVRLASVLESIDVPDKGAELF